MSEMYSFQRRKEYISLMMMAKGHKCSVARSLEKFQPQHKYKQITRCASSLFSSHTFYSSSQVLQVLCNWVMVVSITLQRQMPTGQEGLVEFLEKISVV